MNGDDHVRVLVDRVTIYASTIRGGIQRAGDLNDPVTEDLLTHEETRGAADRLGLLTASARR